MDKGEGKTKLNDEVLGIGYGLLACISWGLLPLYWKLLDKIPSDQILAHRIFWSFIFVLGIITFTSRWNDLKSILSNRKNVILIFFSSMVISINWFTYIWAVNSNHVVEASMGYFINPLLVILLGVIVLKEKLNILQYLALVLACIGVIVIAVQYGKIPWIALTLAVSFSIYGLIKKTFIIDSILALALETIILTPLALAFLIFKQMKGIGVFGVIPFSTLIILMLSGVATATPLLWFAKGAKRVKMSTMGFLQYISPTLSLILGIFVFKEPFTKTHFISFSFIWIALIVYSISKTSFMAKKCPALVKNI